jgi:hypothetical protein
MIYYSARRNPDSMFLENFLGLKFIKVQIPTSLAMEIPNSRAF